MNYLKNLMLFSIFLPAFIAVGVFWYGVQILQPDFWDDQALFYGIRAVRWVFLLLGVFPLLLGVWMLAGATWRRPVLAAAAVCAIFLLVISTQNPQEYTPAEKRSILIGVNDEMPRGTDIYCNGILLGQIPLKIRIDELTAKVPVCTSPPEQRWYDATKRLFTVFPWDIFTADRYRQWQELASSDPRSADFAEKAAKFDAESRYWWRFEVGKNQFCVTALQQTPFHTFVNAPAYDINNSGGRFFSPSVPFYARLLVDTARELGEKDKVDWDKHVLKHWELLSHSLERAAIYTYRWQSDDDFRSVQELPRATLWDSVARLKYNLSEPPTQEESRKLLKNWIESGSFALGASMDASSVPYYTSYSENVLIRAAVEQMKDVIGEPLAQQWTEHLNGSGCYQWYSGWASLLYVSEELSKKDVIEGKNFDALVRFFASSVLGERVVLKSSDERVIPLFKTLLRSYLFRPLSNMNENGYARAIRRYQNVNNPILENTYREFISAALSDPKLRDHSRETVQQVVYEVVLMRLRLEYGLQTPDRKSALKEYAAWISSLPLKSERQKALLQYLSYFDQMQTQPTLASLMQQASGGLNYSVTTEKTAEYVNGWFAEHPQGTLTEFFKEHPGDFSFIPRFDRRESMNVSEQQGLIYALLKIDTPETRKTVRQIWEKDQSIVLSMMRKILRLEKRDVWKEMTLEIPEFYFDLFSTMEVAGCLKFVDGLKVSGSPRAGELLKKWTQSEAPMLRKAAADCLRQWQTAQQVLEKKKELYHDIVTEKICSDDMLIPQPPWRWNGKEYAASGTP